VGIEIGFWNFTETTYTFDITGVTVTFECFNIVGLDNSANGTRYIDICCECVGV
jgi:hypothetical protein